jgi:hypothetical protein
LRKLSIEEDARTVRPYLSSGSSFVYLGALLVYSYLVNLSAQKSKDKTVKIKDAMRDATRLSRCLLVYLYLVNLSTKELGNTMRDI